MLVNKSVDLEEVKKSINIDGVIIKLSEFNSGTKEIQTGIKSASASLSISQAEGLKFDYTVDGASSSTTIGPKFLKSKYRLTLRLS